MPGSRGFRDGAEQVARLSFSGWCTSRGGHRGESERSRVSRSPGSSRAASRDLQLLDFADVWDLAAGEVAIKVAQVLFELCERVALGPVVRVVLEIAQPGVLVLPADDLGRQLGVLQGRDILPDGQGPRPPLEAAGW